VRIALLNGGEDTSYFTHGRHRSGMTMGLTRV
jgi:hypothetical protein